MFLKSTGGDITSMKCGWCDTTVKTVRLDDFQYELTIIASKRRVCFPKSHPISRIWNVIDIRAQRTQANSARPWLQFIQLSTYIL